MNKIKRTQLLCLTAALGIAASGTLLQASSFSKTLKAVYSNIAISYNGQTKLLSTQPFISNGITYVPLRAVSEIMGASTNWTNNTISITDDSASNTSYEQEIAAKNFEIASLKQQLDAANAQLALNTSSTVASNLTSDAIDNTLSQIENDYEDDYDIDWTFDLGIVSNRLELTVSYDSSNDSDDFDDMTESERKSFIKNICYDIEQNHDDVEIRGTLEDDYKNETIADFTYSTSGTLTYNEDAITSLSDLEDTLEDDYDTLECAGLSIPVDSITLDDNDDELDVTITADLSAKESSWNDLISNSEDDLDSDLEDYFGDMISDIEDEYDSFDNINITVKDSSLGTFAYYEDENDYLRTYTVTEN